ncbi:BlaI/MecI/CopY family transcriptional regulator [Bacillus gobiensis]|uniref:BlaI/MecI/CopY family transcriptional regulator n=1 Tax=Bacillus gobiensis TaxID=1441095 RepID=UPI003D20F3FE
MQKNHISILSKLLGPLELQIMKIVWERGEASVQEVLNDLNKENDYAYTTIMTIMSRLVDKEILHRIKSGRFYVYKPAYGPEEFIERMSSQAVIELLDDYGDAAIAQFVGNVSTNREQLDKLKHFIEKLDQGEGEKDET